MTTGYRKNFALDAFLALLEGECPERIVWTADITYWLAGRRQAGAARPQWDTEEGYLQLHQELGILPYYYYEKFWAAEPQYDDSVEILNAEEGYKRTRIFRSPSGLLSEESRYSPSSCSWGVTKHFVESESDLDVLLHILRHRRLEPTNLSDWPARRELWADYGGLPCIGLTRSPLAAMMVDWAGVANTAYFTLDCPQKLSDALHLMEEQETPMLEAVCELAPPLVHFPDNLSSDCSAGLYDHWMATGHRRRIERLHAAGVRCAVHLDGAVKGLLPKLAAVGFDAVEALTPKPAGDLEIEDIRALVPGNRPILWGGVPGVMFAPPYNWEQMQSHVRRLIDSWGDRPFVMGVADQIPPDGNIEFCRKITEILQP